MAWFSNNPGISYTRSDVLATLVFFFLMAAAGRSFNAHNPCLVCTRTQADPASDSPELPPCIYLAEALHEPHSQSDFDPSAHF